MNKKLLISFDQYQKMDQKKAPYTYIVSNEKQHLYYFGSKHTYDHNHPEFIEMESFHFRLLLANLNLTKISRKQQD